MSCFLRRVLLPFIRQLDIPYVMLFSCPICTPMGPKLFIVIADAKAMGMNWTLAKVYVPPTAAPGVGTIQIAWFSLSLASTKDPDGKDLACTTDAC